MKKILLLTDFSEASKKAVHFAQALFEESATEFYLLNAYPIEPDAMYGTAFLMEGAEKEARQRLQEMFAEIKALPVPAYHSYHLRTAPGDPVHVVEAILEQESYDYVVVGASGSGFMSVLGSVATALIRHVKTNVLIVPKTSQIRPLREVLLATDSTTLNRVLSLRPLENLVTLKNARLTALSIVNTRSPVIIGADVERYCQRLAHVFESVDTEAYFIQDDHVELGIQLYLAMHSVDLLVTVPYRKTLMDAVWNRSVTRRLAYKCPVPLLALYDPEPDGQRHAIKNLFEENEQAS